MIYFTSDLHFNHKNIIPSVGRPFKDIDEMHARLIDNWNDVVGDEDIVYILGDFCLGGSKVVNKFMTKLKGIKKYIPGNHCGFINRKHYDASLFELIYEDEFQSYDLNYNGTIFRLSHYPPVDIEQGIVYLHGHKHNFYPYNMLNKEKGIYVYDVGVDANDYAPVSIEKLIGFFVV